MDVQRMVSSLMRAGSQGDSEFNVRPHFLTKKRFAAFAYVAEQYGYLYSGITPGTGATNNPYYSFRRAPDAYERASTTAARHPGMGNGGPLPGMRPGQGLRPLPEARAEVDLLHSRMVVDASSRYNVRVLSNILILLVVVIIGLAVQGFPSQGVLIGGGIWLGFLAVYLLGLAITRRRRAAHTGRLARAGITWPARAQ